MSVGITIQFRWTYVEHGVVVGVTVLWAPKTHPRSCSNLFTVALA